jgi:hypothetical protein
MKNAKKLDQDNWYQLKHRSIAITPTAQCCALGN